MPTNSTINKVTVSLPMGTWLGAETALRNRRSELQNFLHVETDIDPHVRHATNFQIRELTATINAIVDATSSVGD